MVFQGKKNVFERLKKVKPVARPNLAKAFQAAGDTAVQLVFLPGTDHRRILTEMLPEIPKIAGGGSGRDLVDELQWASLGLNLPPKASAQLTIQSRNPVAARSLKKRVEIGLNLLANHPEFRKLINPIEPLRKLLTPQVVGSQLSLTVKAEGAALRMIAAMFTGPIIAARNAAQRSPSMNTVTQLGLAMHNFHDANKSFPPNARYTKKGKKLLSWRVYLLPFLGNLPLFQEFHLDEAWDSPHNKKLIAQMPAVFACPEGN